MYLFTAASADYYMINFYLKYIPGSVFVNIIMASLSSAISNYLSSTIVVKVGSKNSLGCMFGLCAIAAFVLLIAESSQSDAVDSRQNDSKVFPVAVMAAMFGCSASLTITYMAILEFFPTYLLGTVFGISNVVARLITIMSPMIAEASQPTPTVMLIVTCVGASIFSRCLSPLVTEEA